MTIHPIIFKIVCHITNLTPFLLVEKGRFLGISDDAISNNYKRFLRKLELDNELKKEVEKVREDM